MRVAGGGSGFPRFLQGREPVCQHFQGLAQCLEHTGCFLRPMPPSAWQGEGCHQKAGLRGPVNGLQLRGAQFSLTRNPDSVGLPGSVPECSLGIVEALAHRLANPS